MTLSTQQPLRIGLVGAGPWARRVHIPGIISHPEVWLTGLWTRRPEVAAEIARTCGGVAYADLDELLAEVDAVALAVPPAVQAELAVRVAAAGRHLICEKPLAEDAAGARRVVEAVRASGVTSIMMLIWRFAPDAQGWFTGDRADAGPDSVGVARWLSGALLDGPWARSAWRASFGALLDLGPHVIDLLEAALGPAYAVDWASRDEPDLWRFVLRHLGGATSSVALSLALPVQPTEIEVAVFGRIGRRIQTTRPGPPEVCYARMLDEFVGMVRDGVATHACDVRRGLQLQEVIDQVRHAVRR